jgi:HAD superfamily hydrolase (TIGR01490 family)
MKTKNSQKIAIFDIDGTIFRSSLLIELVDYLIQDGLFSKDAEKGYEKEFRAWLDRRGEYEDYIMAVVHVFMRQIKGVKYDDFKKSVDRVVDFHRDRVYRYTRDLISDLKKKNYYIVAISHSPIEIVEAFAASMGFNDHYGKVYEVKEKGIFTGEVKGDIKKDYNKANILRKILKKTGLKLKGSIGVGDTEGDIPLLKLVDHAICFNPNQNLYKYAKKHGWKVVVERKDMIYKF